MPLYACANCGLSEPVALGAQDPGPCPRCCARLRPAGEIGWRRLPKLPFPAEQPRLRLALRPSVEAPTFARRALDGLRDELSEEEHFTARLLTSELVSNVVLHAGECSPPRATATVWICTERMRVDVLDHGDGFRPDVGRLDTDRDSGWGLPLVAEMADDWGVVPTSGSWVWFELLRDGAQADEGASTRRSARTGTSGGSVEASKRLSSSPPSAANEARTIST